MTGVLSVFNMAIVCQSRALKPTHLLTADKSNN